MGRARATLNVVQPARRPLAMHKLEAARLEEVLRVARCQLDGEFPLSLVREAVHERPGPPDHRYVAFSLLPLPLLGVRRPEGFRVRTVERAVVPPGTVRKAFNSITSVRKELKTSIVAGGTVCEDLVRHVRPNRAQALARPAG